MKLRSQYALQFGVAAMTISLVGGLVCWVGYKVLIADLVVLSEEQSSRALSDQMRHRARSVADVLAEALAEPLAKADWHGVVDFVSFVAAQPTIVSVRVHDANGTLIDVQEREGHTQHVTDESAPLLALRSGEAVEHDHGTTVDVFLPVGPRERPVGVVAVEMDTNWVAGVSHNFAERMQSAVADRNRVVFAFFAAIVALLTLASTLLAALLGVRLSRPIVKITSAAAAIARGERSIRIDVTRTDEIGDLARTLEATTASLKDTTVTRDYLDRLVDSMPDAVLVVSGNTIVRFNPAAERLLSVPRERLEGAPAQDYLPERVIQEAAMNGKVSLTTEIICPTRKIPALVSAAQIGQPGAADFVFVLRDIQDIAERENQLRLASERARSADRAKSEFMATMSHELRTPLNAIIGFSELMGMEKLAPLGHPRYKEYIGDIRSSGVHLLAIINDILDISKIEAGQMRLVIEEVDPWETARSAAQLIRERAASRLIELKIDLPSDDAFIPADQIKLKQILLNVLSNAVKFTNPEGRIVMKGELVGGKWATITVSDNGIGMSPEELAIAILPFRQAENASTRQHGGTGLGLPLAIRLTELHGGELLLESEKGKGTRVTITLPAQPGPQALRALSAQGAVAA